MMKKLLILSAVACFMFGGVDAQNQRQRSLTPVKTNVRAPKAKVSIPNENATRNETVTPAPKPQVKRSGTTAGKISAAGKVDVATSNNIFGSLVSEGTLIDYNNDINVLTITNRKPLGVTPPVSNSGIMSSHVSYDKGQTWDTTLYVTQNPQAPATIVNRYPNGVIVNPPGNTTANQAFAVTAGPILDGSAWDGGTFASRRLDGQFNSQVNIQNASATVYQNMPRIGMCSGTNGNVYIQGQNFDWNNTATARVDGGVVNRGVWNAANNDFTWDQTNIYHAFSQDPSDLSQNISSFGLLAFSKDGQTGYHVFIGRDSLNDYLSPMPIIYRTTDAGATWSLYYAGDFTPVFAGIFPNNAQGFMRPFWFARNAFDVQVDAWGKLHIMGEVGIASSNDPDSLNFLNTFNTIFDVYEDQNGSWKALLLGSIWADPADAATGAPNALGWEVGFDGRCQITRSADGTKMAYTWLDTDLLFGNENIYPDIIGVAADFSNSTITDTINFTKNTAWDATNYWLYSAGEGWDNAGTFVVPSFTSRALTSSGDQTVAPWMHEFVTGIEFPASAFTNSFSSVSELPITVNTVNLFPNPGTDFSNLVVDLKSTQNISVNLLNAMGQVVKSFDFGTTNAGSNKFRLDLSDVATGLYVVQMNIGSEVTSRVLSVQK